MEGFLGAIVQVGIFMICSQALLHFGPNGSYEKYLRVLVGVMILLQIFLPIFRFLPEEIGDLEGRISYFQEQLQEAMEDARKLADQTEKRLELEMREGTTLEGAESEEEGKGPENAGENGENEESGGSWENGENGESGEGRTSDSIRIDRIEIELGGANEDGRNLEEME